MRICGNCGLSSADRIPHPDVLSEIYANYYTATPASQDRITLGAKQQLATRIAKQVRIRPGQERAELLDFGGGDGSLAVAIAQRLQRDHGISSDVIIVEKADLAPVDSPDFISITQVKTTAEIPERTQDLVIASAVLEHSPAPVSDLEELLDRLCPGGVFFARTPFHMGMAMLLGTIGRRFNFGYPAHLHDMGDRFWESVLSISGRDADFHLEHSGPSTPASSWRTDFLRTLAVHVVRSPRLIFRQRYPIVGGWEVFIRRGA